MFYYTKMCPYCGARYEHRNSLDAKYHLGNPFLRCSHCGKEFIDKDCIEIETTTLKLQKELLIEAIILDLSRSESDGVLSHIKHKGEAKKILESGGIIYNDELCESIIRTMNQNYLNRLKSIGCEYHPLDKGKFFYSKHNMTLLEYIEKYINEDGTRKDNSLAFKKGYYS